MPKPTISPAAHRRIHDLARAGEPLMRIPAKLAAEGIAVALSTVSKYAKIKPPAEKIKPPADKKPTASGLPESVEKKFPPLRVTDAGVWLVLGDVHVPHHDRATLELAVAAAKKRGCVGVLLNGDVLDSHEVSRHDRDPSAPRYVDEVERGKQFLAWLRKQLPKARVVYKMGNHEERLDAYIVQRAPALFDLEGVNLESLLHFAEYGVEAVRDRRVVRLGALNVIHGHEYPGGASSPVNPARGLYLKARSVALCGHHHRSSYHPAKNIKGEVEAAWSVGCACDLTPRWMPLNDWNHGFALVDLDRDGKSFAVDNKIVIGGKVL